MLRRSTTLPRILIAGGGPVGLTLGILLQHVYNIPVDIVERQMKPTQHPQAHFMNLRTMEILRTHLPALHDRILDTAAPPHQWRDYVYCSRVINGEIARVDQFGPDILTQRLPGYRNELDSSLRLLSPTQPVHFPQNKFETMLSEYAADVGVQIQRGDELKNFHTTSSGINVAFRKDQRQYDFVIGADGAHSQVRSLLKIPMEGPPPLQSLVNVHFTSHALSNHARTAPAMLYFIFNPKVIGVLIAHDLAKGEWVFQIPCFPLNQTPQADYPPSRCVDLIREASGSSALDVDIHSIGGWKMTAQVARDYVAASNRVFLVGDAAHQFPPAGGFGMNTGIQDAHNLAWKLAHHIKTKESSGLLQSYGTERKAVAQATTKLSLRNFERTLRVTRALHVSYDSAKNLNQLTSTSLFKFFPSNFQSKFVTSAHAVGTAHLSTLDNPSSSMGMHMKRRVREIVQSYQTLGMLFYHADIGYSYAKSAIINTADAVLNIAHRFTTEPTESNGDYFIQKLEIGQRLPHHWLHSAHDPTTKVSTLDLAQLAVHDRSNDDNSPRFILLTRQDAYNKVQNSSLPLCTIPLLKETDPPLSNGYHLDENSILFTAAAVLIRPDGHVSWIWHDTSDFNDETIHEKWFHAIST